MYQKLAIGLFIGLLVLTPYGVSKYYETPKVEAVSTVLTPTPKPQASVKPKPVVVKPKTKGIKETSCIEVRKYVNQYGWSTVEQGLKNRRVSESRIALTKTCIK